MKRFKNCKYKLSRTMMPLHKKILWYFLLFTAFMTLFLWVFQIIFLDSFYRGIKLVQINTCNHSITENIENKNFSDLADNIAARNDIDIEVYDTSNNLYTRCYSSNTLDGGDQITSIIDAHRIYQYYENAEDNGGTYTYFTTNDGKKDDVNIKDFGSTDSKFSGAIPAFDNQRVQQLTSATIVNSESGTQYLVVLNARITPVSSIVSTLRYQLVIITMLLIFVGFFIAIVASKKIAKPITQTNKNAKLLAEKNYNVNFDASGYLEVEELNQTLNYATSELKKTDDLQRELIANISHDLRTPLTMITGYGEVMRDLPGENTPENIQIIIDEAKRLSALVSDLLDISKIQSGVSEFDADVFSLTQLVKDIFERYTKLKENDGYKLKFEYDEDISIYGDGVKMGQVIYNLMNNAINYAGDKKEVIVRQTREDDQVKIEVIDHGQGISQENLGNIWDRYYKVDKEHKSSVVGTGLGLSIVKGVLDMHKAHYGVNSVLGEGSDFWFVMDVYQNDVELVDLNENDSSKENSKGKK